MGFITIANMRKGVLLHKLVILELILSIWQGFWLFPGTPVYSWWLSVSGLCINSSGTLHNVTAWMKVAPFLSRRLSRVFIWTVVLVQPYWILEVYANFAFFHGHNDIFLRTRPWEALCRDPWWISAGLVLLWKIKTTYDITLKEAVSISPRFGIMLLAGILSVIFFVLGICAVTGTLKLGLPNGLNTFWKMSLVFKCLTDCVILDDFKVVLDRLRAYKLSRIESSARGTSNRPTRENTRQARSWEDMRAGDLERGNLRRTLEASIEPFRFDSRNSAQTPINRVHDPMVAIPDASEYDSIRTMEAAYIACDK